MKFIALIYGAPDSSPAPGTPEFETYMGGYRKATNRFMKDGAFIAGEALQGTDTATTVRIRKGKAETMDGPFAETKEQLGGFYLLECKDLDQAIAYAKLIPDAKYGCVELRPIMDIA
jgi:hypothetical protein